MAYYLPWLANTSGGGYVWYPPLDLTTIPWYTASGAWGSQYTIPVAAAPVTTSSSSPTTFSAFQSDVLAGSKEITIAAGVTITCSGYIGPTITDVDIIIEPGGALINFWVGETFGSNTITINRLRVRGPTIGSYSGGQLHDFNAVAAGGVETSAINDLIFDGIGITGANSTSSQATNAINVQMPGARFAMQYCRLAGGGEGYIGGMSDAIICGNSVLTALTNPETVEDESWGFRMSNRFRGSLVFYQNDIRASVPGRTNVFHRIRAHPDAEGAGHLWISDNLFVDQVESRLLACTARYDGNAQGWLESFITDGNRYYADGGGGIGFESDSALYNLFRNETFYSAHSLSDSNLTVFSYINSTDPEGTGRPDLVPVKVTSNNTYNGSATAPAWEAAGDPSGLNWNI